MAVRPLTRAEARGGVPAASLRALLVEDEFVIALVAEAYLHDLGIEEVVVVGSLSDGLAWATSGRSALALLDVNLNGEMSFPIAAVPRERGVPLTFRTGYGAGGIEEAFADCSVLTEPYALA